MTAKEARRHYIDKHPLGHLIIARLKARAIGEGILVYGNKAEILQCFGQSKHMAKLFRINKQIKEK